MLDPSLSYYVSDGEIFAEPRDLPRNKLIDVVIPYGLDVWERQEIFRLAAVDPSCRVTAEHFQLKIAPSGFDQKVDQSFSAANWG